MQVHMIIRDAADRIVGLKTETLKLVTEEHGFMSVQAVFTHNIDKSSPLYVQ
jgi:hypothetical protein